jgi:hypothetical protein
MNFVYKAHEHYKWSVDYFLELQKDHNEGLCFIIFHCCSKNIKKFKFLKEFLNKF